MAQLAYHLHDDEYLVQHLRYTEYTVGIRWFPKTVYRWKPHKYWAHRNRYTGIHLFF